MPMIPSWSTHRFPRCLITLAALVLLTRLGSAVEAEEGGRSSPTRQAPHSSHVDTETLETLEREARGGSPPESRARALFELRHEVSSSMPEVIELFTGQSYRETDPGVLRQVISGLEELPAEFAVDPLCYILDTTELPELRQRVVEALFRFRARPEVQDRLQKVLTDDPSPAVRQHVPLWLGLLQDPGVFHALAQAYDLERDPAVKVALISGIALQRSPEAEQLLARIAAQDADGTLREAAGRYLGFRQGKPTAASQPRHPKAPEQIVECEVSKAVLQQTRPAQP